MHTQKINWMYVVFAVVCFVMTVGILHDGNKTKEEDSVVAFVQRGTESAEAHAEELLRALYGRRVTFRCETGDGTVFSTRYYCSNVCMDACADGSVRYLCDIRAVGGEDPLLQWLFGQEKVQLIRSRRE